MLKNILKLNGTQELGKKEQKEVNGGRVALASASCTCHCPDGTVETCVPDSIQDCVNHCLWVCGNG